MSPFRTHNKGFSLVEMLVYVGVVSIVLLLVVAFIANLMRSYTRFRVEREISTNIRGAMNYMLREVKSAEDVYAPTSSFGVTPGQLSLETRTNLPADETTTFIDFYVDDGQLFIKREGQNPSAITSDRVRVTTLRFNRFDPPGIGESVEIELALGYREGLSRFEFQEERRITSSASVRSQY